MNNISIGVGEAAINAVLGYAVVFFGLILLMCVVVIMGRIMASRKDKARPSGAAAGSAEAPAAAAAGPETPPTPAAPGTAGELKLYDTDPRTAAMIMAIVADEMRTPLNELRFQSIKEVK